MTQLALALVVVWGMAAFYPKVTYPTQATLPTSTTEDTVKICGDGTPPPPPPPPEDTP